LTRSRTAVAPMCSAGLKENEKFSVGSMCRVRAIAYYSLSGIFIASTEPRGLSARFLIKPTTVVTGSEEKADERVSK